MGVRRPAPINGQDGQFRPNRPLGAELPKPGTPAFYALEAEEHLAAADKLGRTARTSAADASEQTRRLLAATASAQLGMLKLGLQFDSLTTIAEHIVDDLTEQNRGTT